MKTRYLIVMLVLLTAACGPAVRRTRPLAPEVELDVPFEPNLGGTCFASSFAMVMRYWGKPVHVGHVYRVVGAPPFDRATLSRLDWWMRREHGLRFHYLPGSSIEDVKFYLNEGYPVIVNQAFGPARNTGHSRVVVGYSDRKRVFIVNDPSRLGPGYEISYTTFRELWWKIVLSDHASSYGVYLVVPLTGGG